MKHKISLPRRAAAFALAFLLVLPNAYAAAGEQKLQTSTQIAQGLTYRNTVTVNDGSRVESFSFELSPDSPVRPILWQGSETIYTSATINWAVSTAQAAGYHVVGGVNTDFFNMSNGVPEGVVVEDGIYKSSAEGTNALAFTGNRAVLLEAPEVVMTVHNEANGFSFRSYNFNKVRHYLGGIYVLNRDFSEISTHTHEGDAGWYVRTRAVPDPYTGQLPKLTVNSTIELEVVEVFKSDQVTTIGADEYILTASDGAEREDAYTSFQPGDRVTLSTACADPDLSEAEWACGVGDIMVKDGVMTDSSKWVYAKDGRQPRTAVGIKPDGTVVLYAVDGRQTGYSVGLSQKNLADELMRQGCTWAANLDGGGSTSISAWLPGEGGTSIQNSPSDGRPRRCATFLLLVTDQRGDGQASRLAMAEEGQVVLAGSSLTLPEVKALDEGLNLVSADLSSLAITPLNGLGTVDGGVYRSEERRVGKECKA